jgi:hypothetical protein
MAFGLDVVVQLQVLLMERVYRLDQGLEIGNGRCFQSLEFHDGCRFIQQQLPPRFGLLVESFEHQAFSAEVLVVHVPSQLGLRPEVASCERLPEVNGTSKCP